VPSKNTNESKQSLDEKPEFTPEELENIKNDQEATRMAEAMVKALNEAVLKNHPTS
jgi:hypothetical protein